MGWRFTPVRPRRRASNINSSTGGTGGTGGTSGGVEAALPDPFFGIRRSELTDVEKGEAAGEVSGDEA